MKLVSIVSLLLAVVALETVNSLPTTSSDTKRVVCYFGSWAVYRYGPAKITTDMILPELCTHFIYTFVGLEEFSGKAVFLDAWNDIGDEWHKGAIQELRKKTRATGTKMILAIGGWNEGSERYSKVVADPVRRAILISSFVKMANDYNMDGLDLDWEYPTLRGGAAEDRANFALLCKELAAVLHSQGKTLSAAVNANALLINLSYDVPEISKHLDYINVMAYDLHGSWDSKTGHNAPLFGHHTDTAEEKHLNVAAGLQKWIDLGCPPQKLNMGLGLYGRSFTLLDQSQHAIGAPAGGIPPSGWIQEPGFYAYKEICTNNGTVWKTEWDDEQQVPYAYSGRNWVGYDDELSIHIKTCFAKSLGLGGMMVWSIETDDFDGSCKKGRYPLLNAISSALQDSTCGSPNNQVPEVTTTNAPEATTTAAPETTTPAPTTTTPAPTTTTPAPTTTTPAPTTTTTPPEVETTTSDWDITGSTPPPPPSNNEDPSNDVSSPSEDTTTEELTTIPPPSDNPCQGKEVGSFVRDPVVCNVFYQCAFGADGSVSAFRFSCADTLAFDEQKRTCVHRVATRC